MFVPIVSLKDFEKNKNKIGKQLRDACEKIGFFYVVDHGLSLKQIENTFSISKKFFDLPIECKREVKISSNCGYVEVSQEALNPESNMNDYKEAFNIGNSDQLNKYPSKLPEMKEQLESFFKDCQTCALQILRGLAIGLEIDEYFFENFHKKCDNTLRILHYPASSCEIRAGAHSDYGSITLLFQDDVGGLQVLPKGTSTWVDVKPIKNSIVVNIGDLMMRWTNDLFVSTKHRVINMKYNQVKSRYSIAYFVHPDFDSLISTIETCKGEKEKYEPINSLEYLLQRLNKTYKY